MARGPNHARLSWPPIASEPRHDANRRLLRVATWTAFALFLAALVEAVGRS
jgi:hypothetical protein